MTTVSDLLFVGLFAGVTPLLDYAVFWPARRRLSQADPAWARRWLCVSSIGNQWTLGAFAALLWMAGERPWTPLGFAMHGGWRAGTALGVIVLLTAYFTLAVWSLVRSAEARASLRQQMGRLGVLMPHTRADLYWFGGVSFTAGFVEEFLYRGYFIWVFAPWLGWWGAAALSLLCFAISHRYQG